MKHDLAARLRLYVITDERPDVDELLRGVEEAVRGGATAVQLRRKHDDARQLVDLGLAIRSVTRAHNALYVVNDRVDIALLTDADGVHVGQADISCRDARRLMGNKIVGVSAASVEEALQAQADGADYLGVGSIYATATKGDADRCSLEELAEIAQRTSIPIVAIGGISQSRTPEVIRRGADGVAVVSAIMKAQSPREASAEFASVLQRS